MALDFNQTTAQVPAKGESLKVFVIGNNGIGKSTFASTFPKPLIITTDGNAVVPPGGLAVFIKPTGNGESGKITGYAYLWQVVKQALADPNIKTIVFDLASDVINFIVDEVLRANPIKDNKGTEIGTAKHLQEVGGFALGFTLAKKEFREFMNFVTTTDKNIVFVSWRGETYDDKGNVKSYTSDISPKNAFSIIKGYCNVCAYLDIGKDGKRFLVINPSEKYDDAFNRFGITKHKISAHQENVIVTDLSYKLLRAYAKGKIK